MTNLCNGKNKYKHNWDEIKIKVEKRRYNIALVSIQKEKSALSSTVLDKLRKRNDYIGYMIKKIMLERETYGKNNARLPHYIR